MAPHKTAGVRWTQGPSTMLGQAAMRGPQTIAALGSTLGSAMDSGTAGDTGPAGDGGSGDASTPPCLPLPPNGTSAVFNGTIETADPTYAVPIALCPSSLVLGDAHRDVYTFCAPSGPAAVRIRLESVMGTNGLFNPYLVVYDGPGIPSDTLMCKAANDDDGNSRNSEIPMLSIAQGQQITVVASGPLPGHLGDYVLTVIGL